MHSISTVRSRDDHERHSRPAGSNGPEDQGPPAETCGGRFLGKLSGALHCVGCGAHKPPKLRIQPKSFGTVERLRPRRLPRQQPVARGARLSSQGWGWLRGQSRSAARHHAAVTQGRRSSCRGAKCFGDIVFWGQAPQLPRYGVFAWFSKKCMTLGSHGCGGTRALRDGATADLIAFLGKSGF